MNARTACPHKSLLCLLALAGLLLSLGCTPPASAPQPPADASSKGTAPPPFSLRDVNGMEHRPFASPDVRAVALLFVLQDCPIANGYAPEIIRLCREYHGRGARFYLVQVDPDLSDDEARKHAREHGYTCPVVVDRQHVLVRHAGATMVPEAAVFAPSGERQYRGRIDDRHAALGKRRPQPTSHDLRQALDAVLAQRPVAQPETQPVGCFIQPLSQEGSQP
jgi:AhpC/TSA family